MTEMATTSTNNWLIVGQQAWFQPMASMDNLPPFPVEKVNMWNVSTGMIVSVKKLLGRGPVDYQLTTFPRPFVIYNSDVEPIFDCPGYTSQEAAIAIKYQPMKIVVDENTAIFFVEVYASIQVSTEFFNEYQQEQITVDGTGKRTGGPHNNLIHHLLLQTKDVLDTVVGAYALYKYPLVWKPLDKTSFIQTHNQETSQLHRITEERVGGFIPYQLKLKEAAPGGVYSDSVDTNIRELIKTNLRLPFMLLQYGLWQDNETLRFLLHFWIIEHFAHLHKTEDEKTRKFVVELEQLVKAHFNSESIELFKQKKGELLRSTLLENIKSCLRHFNISYKEEALMRAKKVRDQLSHGQPVDDLELTYVEGEIKHLPRLLLRKALEEKGINLSPDQGRPAAA